MPGDLLLSMPFIALDISCSVIAPSLDFRSLSDSFGMLSLKNSRRAASSHGVAENSVL